jgi:hypothetical protein
MYFCQLHSYNKLVDVTNFQLVYWGYLDWGLVEVWGVGGFGIL